jgi:group I intron endonuclease
MSQDTTQKIWSLYKIINLINGKIYIGQTVQPEKRWYQHRRDAANPKYPIHFAINKYGAHNFEFEVIASCKSQDDANCMEEELIKQYDSLVKNGKGYNISLGGMVAQKSDEWKQALEKWRSSLTQEEKDAINKKRSDATIKQIETQGHPSLGKKRNEEQLKQMSLTRQDHPIEYTEEIRQHMSKAHIGLKDTEETKKRKSESIKKSWEKRHQNMIMSGELKCNAPGCNVSGIVSYLIVNNIRYCYKHGDRLKRTGFLELQQKKTKLENKDNL